MLVSCPGAVGTPRVTHPLKSYFLLLPAYHSLALNITANIMATLRDWSSYLLAQPIVLATTSLVFAS